MHELDVDTLVLASAGISADEIDWTLLGLNPPDIIVGSPQSGDESSSPDEPSTEASSTPRSLAPVLRRHPRPRHLRRNASGTRPLGRRPRVRLRHSCPPPSGLAVRLSTFGRGPRPLLHNVQAVLRVISKLRSPHLRLPLPSGHLVVSRPRVATLL
ncbi:hypothetical protein PF003_g18109 [Phytophthora fragariae]|nr:hypothetical protein PF003_g18109 [Phytophthora fragariae]